MNCRKTNYSYWVLLISLSLLPGLLFASPVFTKGLLWKIESNNTLPNKTKPSYLFGTMHTEDPRVISMPVVIKKTFAAASSFTLEVKLDSQVALDTISMMTLKDGRNLKAILGESLYAKSSALMASYGMPAQMVNLLKPWAVFVSLSTPISKSGQFLDKVLYDEAVSNGKTIYGLETAKEQLVIFDTIPMKEQVVLLEDTIKNHDKLPEIIEQMTKVYLARDLGGLLALNEKYMKEGNANITKKLMKRLLVDRNLRMVDRMANQLEQGDSFIAVGALHLPGETGILNLLQAKGYKVSVVY